MKYKYTIIILFFVLSVLSRRNDNEIYSLVLNDINNRWYNDTITEFVIINRSLPSDNYIDSYYHIRSLNNQLYSKNNNFSYDTAIAPLVEKKAIQKCLLNLQSNFYLLPEIKDEKLKINYTTILSKEFDSLFEDPCQGWYNFYSIYPKSATVVTLSGIEFTGNYACLYLENLASGLDGWGGVIITQKVNNRWKIIEYIPIWEGWNYCEY
jgi:hypothetical protein